jgi:hypothetical protein
LEGFQKKDLESKAANRSDQMINIEKSATFCGLASE